MMNGTTAVTQRMTVYSETGIYKMSTRGDEGFAELISDRERRELQNTMC
jgi:hypothetical protein